ncbi:MAG: exodeoxyribonuclease V subunit gamma [gamma proteobacterium symbiont of Bathyaustriella thionipta]|nr:exodeoxyribonuclease V subunit gamma [gamma proteobacterium symbiont of Bathyaustriella thionipta]MCU7950034.1 exodeoxyribonuclease V subunit gamma [gamma proteobacterium symbiont of Bathyaustriella thionipta]MCU7954230.1 exodeoxyribonuclease V subunit gamma [gamma proteobacterium symbiont of Bathyaustriella thionipta]MCU7956623.1 exodeoxyribonuclease V subunit gamma [gamma proteobacterium symbiont of Bathyaustriella thionipta]MCU7967742.1 exodeoxyribonuclease V subunit gamma [gamma proteoba
MINIYPANRLENLVILFDRVMQTGTNDAILSEEIILVQSKGMQHWLNLKLAESRGISMNLSFSLPMQFFWNQIRAVLGKDNVSEKSTYTREVLSWRIHELLASDRVINNPLCEEATRYWAAKEGLNKKATAKQSQANEDKRFQLACQLADLFEQYLIFRPDWIIAWEKGSGLDESLEGPAAYNDAAKWQAFLWQLLVEQDLQHPVHLLKETMESLKQHKYYFPERISLFGINTLPPIWLEFLSELGQQTQVHVFHLNPCVEYWGDLKTDKSQAKEQFYRWLNSSDLPMARYCDEIQPIETSNPLLSNLGAQGKDFLYLLAEHSSIEIPVYESPEALACEQGERATVLQQIQSDILQLRDRRYPQSGEKCAHVQIDNSITLASAHSALREIQALHDWLLHQINNDNSLTPKDILVMCPNVENYAPYVDAVFAHGWSDWSEHVPPLPCSIADRTLKDLEPLVQAFINLLDLPDSRFQVSQILGYLRLPALQEKFNFSEDNLLLLERWINHAAIHWGLDGAHKQHILNDNAVQYTNDTSNKNINDKFSWHQGLNRLLLGFAKSDQTNIYQNQLLLPDVEGDEALLLGRYFELLEQLQYYAQALTTDRTPNEWQQFLLQAKEALFSSLPVDSNAQQIIEQAIDDLGEYTHHANYDKKLPLSLIRDFLLNHFSQAEPGRQFMAGQVTFCSMVPMRSVPFRVIAVLGLNDGEFPRQRQPMGFDLMSMTLPRKGDRSRRGDDRYLFLEALISCRERLYLSYQGHDIKTNNKREPSLVLQELIDYLEKGYGWQLLQQEKTSSESPEETQLLKVPLQAFNIDNYSGMPLQSFNAHWLKLSEAGNSRNNLSRLDAVNTADNEELSVNAEQLVQFFENPCKQFAQHRLGLYLEANRSSVLDDTEPFVTNHLDRYLIQDKIVSTALMDNDNEQVMTDLMRGFSLSGTLPDTPAIEDDLQQWQEQACEFAEQVNSLLSQSEQALETQAVSITIDNMTINAELPVLNNRLLYWRLATAKGKDDMRLWIHHLIAQIAFENSSQTYMTQGLFRGTKDETLSSVYFEPLDNAHELLADLLQCWQEGMQSPLLLNAALGQKHCLIKKDRKNQPVLKPLSEHAFSAFWHDDFQTQGLGSDPYVHWFWGDSAQIPQWQAYWQSRIEKIYQPLYAARQENVHND